MSASHVFTIGYGQRSADEFIALLRRYQISYLIDVRSQPYSRFNSQFTKDALERLLLAGGVRYVFMGDSLGGRPADGGCYTDGRVDYSKVQTKPFYSQGISRLMRAWHQHLSIAIMCSEIRPQDCHRAKLIAETLHRSGVSVMHIDESGHLISHQEVLCRLNADRPSLFSDQSTPMVSRKRYRQLVPKNERGDQATATTRALTL